MMYVQCPQHLNRKYQAQSNIVTAQFKEQFVDSLQLDSS